MATLIAPPAWPRPTSLAKLLKTGFDAHDLNPMRRRLLAQSDCGNPDAAALLDLSIVEQILGDPSSGLRHQAEALRLHRVYRSSWPASPSAVRVLVFLAPGEIGANTPIDFLLQGSDSVLYAFYVGAGQRLPHPLPDHDIAIVAVGESDEARPVLSEIERLIPTWPCPVLNRPASILRLSREEMHRSLRGIPGLIIPATVRIGREDFEKLGQGLARPGDFLDSGEFPLIARTIGSHAGRGLMKLDHAANVGEYLAAHPDAEFFLSPFVDYRSPDGFFRKYRIVWVDGRPYPVHMAIASEWKVWYLNAAMDSGTAKRAEEASFLSGFDTRFALRHAGALAAIVARFGLEYMGIDCGETPHGKLLIFEGDIAMAAHDMDPPELYPYKRPHMRRLFAAFYNMLKNHAKQQPPMG